MGSTNAPYNLPWPEDGEIADVPQDIKELAQAVALALNGTMTVSQANAAYQSKISYGTTLPPSGTEGAVFFVIG
jgi:hypothetical protein